MEPQLLSDAAYITTGVYLTIIGVMAFLGNVFVLFVLTKGQPNFITIHKVMMYVIAVSDLMVSTIAYPLTAVSGYNKRWYFSEATCVATAFIVYFFTLCTICSLSIMAITRYIIVCKPELEKYIRDKRIVWWMLIIFAYSIFWAGSPLVGWSGYGHEPFMTSCTLNWFGESVADVTYNSLCIMFCYVVPLAIFMFCYFNVAKTSLLRSKPVDISFNSGRIDMDHIIEQMARNSKLRASRHMTFICLAMVISFFVTWTPYAVVTFINLVTTPVSSSIQVLPTMFAKLNCVMNPIIYSAFCDRFREAAFRVIPCRNKVLPVSCANNSDQQKNAAESDGARRQGTSEENE